MNDGDVRVWKEISDDDPSSFCIGESANCCAVLDRDRETMLIASTDTNTVQFFKFPEGTQDKVLFRFSAPVTAIKTSKKVYESITMKDFLNFIYFPVDCCRFCRFHNQTAITSSH